MAIPAEFRETLERYRFAAEPDCMVVNVRWPAFDRFDDAVRTLLIKSRDFATAKSVDLDLARYRRARAILRSSLAAPRDPDVGLLEADPMPPVTGDLGALQAAVRAAAAALADDAHAAVVALGEILASSTPVRWPHPGHATVVVAGQAKAATERSLAGLGAEQGVTWQVCSLTEARTAGHAAVTLLAGSPELLLDWRTPPEQRSRLVSWLFNAPMSPHVVAMLWPGSLHFDSDRYEPFPGADTLDPRIVSVGALSLPTTLSFDDFELPPAAPRPASAATAGETTVESIDLMLPDRQWISFGVEDGPRPRRIDSDAEFAIEIESATPEEICPGDILVVLEATANRELRRQLCGEWISANEEAFDIDDALRKVDAYKSAVRRMRYRDDLVRKLVDKQMPEQYVRSQIARAFNPDTIAPQRLDDFRTIAHVLGLTVTAADWEHVKALRSGFTHAGRVIAGRLRDAVRSDSSWLDVVGQQQIASIAVAGLGRVTLAPVLRVADERSQRPESQLGVIGR